MVLGTEYYSKRGWAPNGDFRYRGDGLDHLTARWNALFDRGFKPVPDLRFAGGTDDPDQTRVAVTLLLWAAKDLSAARPHCGERGVSLPLTLYRLVFNDNYWLAVSSEVKSDVSYTHTHNGIIPSVGRVPLPVLRKFQHRRRR